MKCCKMLSNAGYVSRHFFFTLRFCKLAKAKHAL